MRCCDKLGIEFVTVYSLEDRDSLHVTSDSVCLHPTSSKPADTYLDQETLFRICKEKLCDAIHPGYGFLSENAEFARECEAKGLIFIGPTPDQIAAFGLKHSARALARKFGVPLLPGTDLLNDVHQAKIEAKKIGYPVLLKCAAGGGGIGMKVCDNESDLIAGFESVKRLGLNAFKDDGVFLEKFLPKARHVEVQVFGDGQGNVIAIGERDCSTQRRNQKVVEESPAPFLTQTVREKLWDSAVRLMKGVQYRTAGTVEFIMDAVTLDFYFLEVNTRIQVEHGVTEQVYSTDDNDDDNNDLDLIEWMIRASTKTPSLDLSPRSIDPRAFATPRYHSIQCRIYAEDANKNFQPAAGGILTCVQFPPPSRDVRIETWVRPGCLVSSLYDPMIAKLIVRGKTREEARSRMLTALAETSLAGGVETNVEFLEKVVGSDQFVEFDKGRVHTNWLKDFEFVPRTIDVLDPGTQTSVQDYPGRVGYWAAGVPPSGPMDHLAFRVANRLVGNAETCAGLEMTIQGATLRFNCECLFALTGAEMAGSELDGQPVRFWETMRASRGSVLRLGAIGSDGEGGGCRAYLAVGGGGLDVPAFLGSKSTFALGKFGGHAGRNLVHGDVLHLHRRHEISSAVLFNPLKVPMHPRYSTDWDLHVLMGPHSCPDFFTEEFIASGFFHSTYTVHYNSNRMGIRLTGGPKPDFARLDGGEAGLHPSNIHDTVYAIGTINFTGDMPVILGLDGPSLGGFVCPATVVKADLWKIGQLRPGDSVRFALTTYESAVKAERELDARIDKLSFPDIDLFTKAEVLASKAVLREFYTSDKEEDGIKVVYRQAGDKNVLIEYGELVLDLLLRCRVHALIAHFNTHHPELLEGIIELSPGVRSLQVHFDSRCFSSIDQLLDVLQSAENELGRAETMEIPSRIIHLPLAFEASSTLQAINKYRQSVRDTAPWLPSNIEFIRRINGLDSQEQVKRNVFEASYLVLGLGDVYLGAPCAVPLDPRHRLLTTKYNPARTWTEEGEVGIGGVFMCIYGMQSPGGYQLVGRTVPIWSNYLASSSTKENQKRHHWLLESFDQIRFHPVSEEALMDCRRRLARGDACEDLIRIEPTSFVVSEYLDFLKLNREDIAQFQSKQRIAFERERDSWAADDAATMGSRSEEVPTNPDDVAIPETCVGVRSQIAGNVWDVAVREGDEVKEGQTVVVIEAMKLEINVPSPIAGRVVSVQVKPGSKCSPGDLLLVIDRSIIPSSRDDATPSTPVIDMLSDMSIAALHRLYFDFKVPVASVMKQLVYRIETTLNESHPFVWISRRSDQAVLMDCDRLDVEAAKENDLINIKNRYPLFGIPFACKDNIDCKDLPTTCACPDFSYLPLENAHVVQTLLDAGAILIGKTNMDQFAAGLVGARSPYCICRSVRSSDYVSGGTSSGSGVAVGSGMVAFALGTDTAGSGRVPAMLNDVVGLKPSKGTISARGVVPACKSLDCVSVFATSVDDALAVFQVAAKVQDVDDPYSRPRDVLFSSPTSADRLLRSTFVFGVPDRLEFFGDEEARASFERSCLRLRGMGGFQRIVSFDVFERTANLLYQGPWVAERLEALQPFFVEENKSKIHPVTWEIISKGSRYSAVDCFRSMHELESLRRSAMQELDGVDFLVCPTAPTHYTVEQVLKDPVRLNSNLGIYTNFVNFLDLSAIAVPSKDYSKNNPEMPFGVTFIASAMKDLFLCDLAKHFVVSTTVDLAVVGAHLSGMPLNAQLVDLGAVLVEEATTASGMYKLFALNEMKPGLVRMQQEKGEGNDGIAVEIWRFPSVSSFGAFVSAIPPPLGMGTIQLEDGREVKSFVCESYAVVSARDITSFGGWKAYKRAAGKVQPL